MRDKERPPPMRSSLVHSLGERCNCLRNLLVKAKVQILPHQRTCSRCLRLTRSVSWLGRKNYICPDNSIFRRSASDSHTLRPAASHHRISEPAPWCFGSYGLSTRDIRLEDRYARPRMCRSLWCCRCKGIVLHMEKEPKKSPGANRRCPRLPIINHKLEGRFDGMVSRYIAERIGTYCTFGDAVNSDSGDLVPRAGGDRKGFTFAISDSDAAGGGDRASCTCRCGDGIVLRLPTA